MTKRAISLFNAFLMLILIIFWGSSFVVVKLALGEGLTPIALATFRFLIAGALFLFALLIKKGTDQNYRLTIEKKDSVGFLLLALIGVTFFFTAQYTGIQMAGASIAAILVCLLSPILIAVLSAKILKEHLTVKQIFGIATAAIGTFIIVISTLSLPDSKNFFLGSLILLSTPFLWATYSLLGRRITAKYNPFLVAAYVTIIGGLCLIPFSLIEGSFFQIFALSLKELLAILFLAVTCSFLGYFIWLHVLEKEGASVTSSFLFAEPLITVLFAIVFFEEKIGLFIPIGGLLIFTGVYLVTMI